MAKETWICVDAVSKIIKKGSGMRVIGHYGASRYAEQHRVGLNAECFHRGYCPFRGFLTLTYQQ